MDPKEPPEGITEAELALYMIQNDIGMVIMQFDEGGNLLSYEEQPVSEDEDE